MMVCAKGIETGPIKRVTSRDEFGRVIEQEQIINEISASIKIALLNCPRAGQPDSIGSVIGNDRLVD